MFTVNIYLRFALIGLLTIVGAVLTYFFGFWYAFPLFLGALILLLGYIFLGTVQSTAQLLQEGELEKADQRLQLTFKPTWLYVTNRAYYYMLKGSIALARRDTVAGEEWLRKAQAVNVPTDNEKAMIDIQLANIAASKGKWKQAQNHYRELKKLNITEAGVIEQLVQLEKALANRGQAKAAMRMGAGGRGGGVMRQQGKSKRKRPKMK